MSDPRASYPHWLVEQKGKPYRSPGYLSRNRLIRRYANHLVSENRKVTIAAVREMLRFVDRGYSLKADQISRALGPLYLRGLVERAPNGSAVRIEGRTYRSARAAAEELGVSPQTILNRVASDRQEWAGWHRAADQT